MNRFELKEMRDLAENNGFFVEDIFENGLLVTHLKDLTESKWFLSLNNKCPNCGTYLLFNENNNSECMCINKECLYHSYESNNIVFSDINEIKTFELLLDVSKTNTTLINDLIEDIKKIIDEKYPSIKLRYTI